MSVVQHHHHHPLTYLNTMDYLNNYHLPYGTDNYETDALVYEAARMAWDQGSKVIVLPTIPTEVDQHQ